MLATRETDTNRNSVYFTTLNTINNNRTYNSQNVRGNMSSQKHLSQSYHLNMNKSPSLAQMETPSSQSHAEARVTSLTDIKLLMVNHLSSIGDYIANNPLRRDNNSNERLPSDSANNLDSISTFAVTRPDTASTFSVCSSSRSRSNRDKLLARRIKLKNIVLVNEESLDLLSSDSSSDESSSSPDSDQCMDDKPRDSKIDHENQSLIRKEACKLADSMLIQSICDFSSDESSISELMQCKPPSIMDHITLSPPPNSGGGNLLSPQRKARICGSNPVTPKRKKNVKARKPWFSSKKSSSFQDLSNLLDSTKPPSVMEMISGKSSASGSNNSLNSVKSDILDTDDEVDPLPVLLDPFAQSNAVNEAASALSKGLTELTKSFEADSIQDTYPVDQPLVNLGDHPKIAIPVQIVSVANTPSNTTTYSLDVEKVAKICGLKRDIQLGPLRLCNLRMSLSKKSDGPSSEDRMADFDDIDTKSDFGVDDLPSDNGIDQTFVTAGESTLIEETEGTLKDDEDISIGRSPATKDPLASIYTDALEDVFSDATPGLQDFQSEEDYERFVMNENAKLLAHTFAEMANCSSAMKTPSDLNDLVSPSLEILNLEDLSLLINDNNKEDEDDDSRATYNVNKRQDKLKRILRRENTVTKIVRSSSKTSSDITYSLETPRVLSASSSSSTGQFFTANSRFGSDTTTYSIDDRPFETPPSELPKPPEPQVKIRETRASALRAKRARSMEVKASSLNQSYHTNFMTPSPSLDSAVSSFVMSLRQSTPPKTQRPRKQETSLAKTMNKPTSTAMHQINSKMVNSCSYQSFRQPYSSRYSKNISNSSSAASMQQSVMVTSRLDSGWPAHKRQFANRL